MARQTAQAHRKVTFEPGRRVTKPASPVRKSTRVSTSAKFQLDAQHPPRESPRAGNTPKPAARQTVSIAGVFKKKSKATNSTRERKTRRHREETPEEPDLYQDFKDGIETARSTILSNTEATFDDVYSGFKERLAESRASDVAFFESANSMSKTLSVHLTEEQLETTSRRDGKRVTEIVKIGDRLALFKASIETEEVKLAGLWKQWRDVQDEYVELGIEVFSEKSFAEDDVKAVKKRNENGFLKEMELLDLEFKMKVEELEEEIGEMGQTFLKRMKSSERELDTKNKKEQTLLLQQMLQD
ncbi:hypothetical protein G7Y89_g1844 [Cudoniella acicularis]|uniref:Uncharacterized protein n=1 Tax=Cudoniella acicularis TaxID=354080 RepID=A0A8H4RUH6_9HELO|nr:hypothetical protein G7Y89_g1844 [Cudoniella acicularis]